MFVYAHIYLIKCSLILIFLQYSLKKGIMKKFENWRYRENKRSPDFEDNKEKKKKKMIVGK